MTDEQKRERIYLFGGIAVGLMAISYFFDPSRKLTAKLKETNAELESRLDDEKSCDKIVDSLEDSMEVVGAMILTGTMSAWSFPTRAKTGRLLKRTAVACPTKVRRNQ